MMLTQTAKVWPRSETKLPQRPTVELATNTTLDGSVRNGAILGLLEANNPDAGVTTPRSIKARPAPHTALGESAGAPGCIV